MQADLARARASFVMTTELHLTYLCVPATEEGLAPSWKLLYDIASNLRASSGAAVRA